MLWSDYLIIIIGLLSYIVVAYWPPTWPSCQNKKCTWVNNGCIQSRMSEMALTVDGLNWVGVKQWYNPDEDRKLVSWRSEFWTQCSSSSCGNQLSAESWAPRPPVEQPRRTRKMHYYGRRTWGGQYIAVFVQSPTSLSHTTLSIKWKVYFSKEVSSLVHWLRRYVSVRICVCIVVMAVQHCFTYLYLIQIISKQIYGRYPNRYNHFRLKSPRINDNESVF